MIDACSAGREGAGFVSSMTGYIDCQAQVLGTGAWQALSQPGSSLAIVLTGLLTIFIALIGYNLLLGRAIGVREGTLAFVKIGAVFALATSWPAYRTLVYDVMTDGPSQLVAEIGPGGGVIGSDGTLLDRLDLADQALAQLAMLGPGQPPALGQAQVVPAPFGAFDSFALGGSRILFLLTAIAGLAIVRVVTGLMLALGPFFIAFLMFDATRSLFEGWVRVLAGAALGAVGVSITLGLELGLMEPWLSAVLARRMAGEALPTMPTELFVMTMLFTIVVIAALYGCARVARAFRLPLPLRAMSLAGPSRSMPVAASADVLRVNSREDTERSRAAAVASVMSAMNRRETLAGTAETRMISEGRPAVIANRPDERVAVAVPVGRSFARRSGARVSARANRRDASA